MAVALLVAVRVHAQDQSSQYQASGTIRYHPGFRGDLPGYYYLSVDGTNEEVTILACGSAGGSVQPWVNKHVTVTGTQQGGGVCADRIAEYVAPTPTPAPTPTLAPTPVATVPPYVVRFAPELRFARSAVGYPESAQPFYDALQRAARGGQFQLVENTSKASLASGLVPTYYQARTYGAQVRIYYWWFYGYQHPCFQGRGAHNGDWENVEVILNERRTAVAAVSYGQHGGHYTRIAGPRDAPCTPGGTGRCGGSHGFEKDGSHPIVYPGKIAHGSYHNFNGSNYGNTDESEGFSQCFYYGDFRNPASDADTLRTWTKLIDLDGSAEAWIAADRTATWTWGPDGISRHPTQEPPTGHEAACDGHPTYAFSDDGCYQSECLAGDDQASEDCLKECKQGYDNAGLTCNKGVLFWEWRVYGRLTGGNSYGYGYTLPQHDVGLTRRRNTESEWDLP